jgi:hypothetical protein
MPHIYTTITVDWDGTVLDDDNIEAMQVFNETFPTLPITHFICPAYLTRLKKPADKLAAVAKINSAIKDIDEVTLHIHCWYSLMMACGITSAEVMRTPTYYENNDPGPCVDTPGERWGDQDCGHGVPFGCYSVPQIKNILAQGRHLLRDAGVKNTSSSSAFQSFRCGGWLAGNRVLNAVREERYFYEASAAPSRYFSEVLQPVFPEPVYSWVAEMWSGAMVEFPQFMSNQWCTQAYPGGVKGMYPIDTTTAISDPNWIAEESMVQIPDTGALADVTAEDTLQKYIEAAANTGRDVFISMGWHADTATMDNKMIHPGIANIEVIMNVLAANLGQLVFCTVQQAGELWKDMQLSVPVFPREEKLVRLKQPVPFPHIPVAGRRIIHG